MTKAFDVGPIQHEHERDEPVHNIARIRETSGLILRDENEIEQYVESPLREACKTLLKKNIRTTTSSANVEEGRREAYIAIDAASLSAANRTIADELGGQFSSTGHGGDSIHFAMSIDGRTPAIEVKRYFGAIADRFQPQFPSWVPRKTRMEALATIRLPLADIDANLEAAILEGFTLGEDGYYYEDPRDEERTRQAVNSGMTM